MPFAARPFDTAGASVHFVALAPPLTLDRRLVVTGPANSTLASITNEAPDLSPAGSSRQ